MRRRFAVPEPEAIQRLSLIVHADDGFIAWLNGEEIGRANAGEPKSALTFKSLPTGGSAGFMPFILSLDPKLFRPRKNCLAIQALNGQGGFYLLPVLKAFPAEGQRDAARREKLLAGLRAAARGESAPARIAYLEGRILEAAGRHLEALEKLRSAAAAAPQSREPRLRIAERLRAAGEAAAAERELRTALEGGLDRRELWEAWAALAFRDLGWSPREALARLPAASSGYAGDLRWLLEKLAAGEAVRLNCGGEDYRSLSGEAWGRDRFYLGGERFKEFARPALLAYGCPIAGTEDDPLYQAVRRFGEASAHPAGYRLPLPRGEYEVVLHFAEVYGKKIGRRFAVRLEGKEAPLPIELLEPDHAAARKLALRTEVADGLLDLELVAQVADPLISALEIRRLN